jgi:hypothetical protein
MMEHFASMHLAGCAPDMTTFKTLSFPLGAAGREEVVDQLYRNALACGVIDPYRFDRCSAAE